MDLEQYKKQAAEQKDWASGWDAIHRIFGELYPGQELAHFEKHLHARANLGGDQYLAGYSIYHIDMAINICLHMGRQSA
jgi:hypothetical protein